MYASNDNGRILTKTLTLTHTQSVQQRRFLRIDRTAVRKSSTVGLLHGYLAEDPLCTECHSAAASITDEKSDLFRNVVKS